MAIFRKIHVTFWSDTFVQSLTPEQKFFYLYLMTNEKTKQCGIYEISYSHISFDTGYNRETVEKLILFFEKSQKVKYSKSTSELALKNWLKYNFSESPSVKTCIEQEFQEIKNQELTLWVQSGDTTTPIRIRTRRRIRIRGEQEEDIDGEKKFVKPTVEEVTNYLTEEKNYDFFTAQGVADHFWNYYESQGWKVSKNPMKVWKSAVCTWLKNKAKYEAKNGLKNDSAKSLFQKHMEANKKLNELIQSEA